MRLSLRTPRSRGRSIAAATLGALALLGSVLVAVPAHALSDTGTGGVFTPAAGKILDTRDGTGGFSTPMPAGSWRTVQIAGRGGLPDDGSVGSVTLDVTTVAPSSQGQAVLRPNLDTPSTLGMIYAGTGSTTNTVTVAVDPDGTIKVATTTGTGLVLELQGYYSANDDGTAPGGFVSVPGKNLVDTRSGVGAPKAAIAAGGSVTVQVGGQAGIPADASGVVANFIAINSTTTPGYLVPFAAGDTKPSRGLNYAASTKTSVTAQIGLSADGKMTITNNKTSVDVAIDIQGYFTATGKGGAVFTPAAGRLLDTRADGQSIVGQNQTRVISAAGQAGIPVMGSGITAVALTVTSVHTQPTAGRAIMWADGTTMPTTTAITYENSSIRSNSVIVPLGANGKIDLYNYGDPTNYVLDLQGWYADPKAPGIVCPDYPAGSWSDSAPTTDITCTVTAAIAAASGESTEIYIDGELSTTVPGDATTVTTTAVNVAATNGAHEIEAVTKRAADDDGGASTVYGFGLGRWSKGSFASAPISGATTETTPTLEVFLDSADLYMPEGATVVYSIRSASGGAAIASSGEMTLGPWQVPSGVLTDETDYVWSAAVTADDEQTGQPVSAIVPDARLRTSNSYVAEAKALTESLAAGEQSYDSLTAEQQDLVHAATDPVQDTTTVAADPDASSLARAASKCWTGKTTRTARSILGIQLYSSWTSAKWCAKGKTVTSASLVDSGQQTFFLGWKGTGKAGGGSKVVSNTGRTWTQYKFQFQLASPVPTQYTQPCTRVGGKYTGGYTSDYTCGVL